MTRYRISDSEIHVSHGCSGPRITGREVLPGNAGEEIRAGIIGQGILRPGVYQ